MTVSHSASCRVHPNIACDRILSESGLHAWWLGKVTITEKDPAWPAVGSRMTWRAGGGTFKAEIRTDARPQYVDMFVKTPSADSNIRHSFDQQADGSTIYTKSVEPIWRNGFSRFMSPVFIPILRMTVKKEVERGAQYADAGN